MKFNFANPDPTDAQIRANLLKSQSVAEKAVQDGKHPFGAVLIGPDHEVVLMEQGNIDTVNHAESTLARLAAEKFDPEYLWNCTLYTTFEPCAMCAATLYWANIGRVVFGVYETDLLELTGDHDENPTMSLPCRDVFKSGQKPVRVWGPVPDLKQELLELHENFWSAHE